MMTRSHVTELFVSAIYDAWAVHIGHAPRWDRLKVATQERWLDFAERASISARASQVSELTGEQLPNAPDHARAFALALSSLVEASSSRATTSAGMRRARRANSPHLDTFWAPAVRQAIALVDVWVSERAQKEIAAAVAQLPPPPDAPLRLDEAPY